MSLVEYDGLELDKAIEKLKSKISWDEEDKAFARARADYLTPEELAVIEGGVAAEVPRSSNQMELNQPEAPATGAPTDENQPGETAPKAGEVEGLASMKMNLVDLQGKAAELDLDTSGTKAELVERINAKLTEPQA